MRADSETVPTVVVRRVIAAQAERIFDLWTQPAKMVQWMSPYPGPVACTAQSDVRAGGAFSLLMGSADSQCEISGIYVEVSRPRKLVFSWVGPPTQGANTLVTVELNPVSAGTELILTHEKLPTAEVREGHAAGWRNMFDHLQQVIT
jgi:uncharacterized protein YndB with AHSA1/START domain